MTTDYDRTGFPSYLLPTVAKIRERWDSLDSGGEADSMNGTEEIAARHELASVPNPSDNCDSHLPTKE